MNGAITLAARVEAVRQQRTGNCSRSARLPAVRQQLVDAAGRVAVDAREHVAQVGPGLDAAEFGRLHQAHHDGCPLAGQLAANEQPVLRAKLPGLDQPFEVVVVDRHGPVAQAQRQRLPVVQAVVDGLRDGAAGKAVALELEPRVQLLPQRHAHLLASDEAVFGCHVHQVRLDVINPRPALQRFQGNGAGAGVLGRELLEPAACVRGTSCGLAARLHLGI